MFFEAFLFQLDAHYSCEHSVVQPAFVEFSLITKQVKQRATREGKTH